MSRARRQQRKRAIWVEEVRQHGMDGKWRPWLPVSSLSRSENAAKSWVSESAPGLQFRAVRYVPERARKGKR
jgi:hypothetical protein